MGWPNWNIAKIFGVRKLSRGLPNDVSWWHVQAFAEHRLVTDWQTDRHRTIAYTALVLRRAVKTRKAPTRCCTATTLLLSAYLQFPVQVPVCLSTDHAFVSCFSRDLELNHRFNLIMSESTSMKNIYFKGHFVRDRNTQPISIALPIPRSGWYW